MNKAKARLLLHPVFILSLTVLLLNDFYWKYTFHNWLTGKLSDFAGLIVLPVFLMALMPKVSKYVVVLFSVLFFTWWKSPGSQPTIHFFENQFDVVLHRTIDYTDLLALTILPVVFWLQPVKYKANPVLQKGAVYVIGFISFFSLCATSPLRQPPYSQYARNEVRYDQEFCSLKTVDEVLQGLQAKGISYLVETERYYPLSYGYDELFYRTRINDSTYKAAPITNTPDSTIYVRRALYQSNYLISSYQFEGDTFQNIRFRIVPAEGKKKSSCIEIMSFESSKGQYEFIPNKKQKKTLKKYFTGLFNLPS